MVKKIAPLLVSILLSLALAGCSDATDSPNSEVPTASSAVGPPWPENGQIALENLSPKQVTLYEEAVELSTRAKEFLIHVNREREELQAVSWSMSGNSSIPYTWKFKEGVNVEYEFAGVRHFVFTLKSRDNSNSVSFDGSKFKIALPASIGTLDASLVKDAETIQDEYAAFHEKYGSYPSLGFCESCVPALSSTMILQADFTDPGPNDKTLTLSNEFYPKEFMNYTDRFNLELEVPSRGVTVIMSELGIAYMKKATIIN